MKKVFYNLFLFSTIIAIVLIGCDKIDEPLSLINQQNIPSNIDDTIFFADSVNVTEKHVLLEDFTGHKCINCPEAALEAHALAEESNHRLIIYAVHAGFYASPDNIGLYTANFQTATGDELNNQFQIFFNPSGLINRKSFNGSMVQIAANWTSVINSELALDNMADMKLKNTYYPKRNSFKIDIELKPVVNLSGKYKVCIFIAEDSIVSPQKNNNISIGPVPDWEDYLHRNILRGALNTTFGEYLSPDGSLQINQKYSKSIFYTPNTNWVTNNCNIIAYVYNEDTWEVIQVAELGLKTE